jgi:hypothetical protein
MNYECFEKCFRELCCSFDLDYERKKRSMRSYYESKLGNLSDIDLMQLIKKARETLIVKTGSLPPIQQLLYLGVYNMPQPKKQKDEESFYGAKCAICSGSGWVIMEKDGYTHTMCCTCKIGQIKQQGTKMGRESGCYKDYLISGYKVHDICDSNDNATKTKLEKIAYEAQKEEIPF